ncbi:SDR family NAD(P)-dependent oxidoreductase [Rhodococcus aetherivorans]|uniref:SDR family NAD(P)-dependent oxidoreductase n=1 Tax=Rhodococcus aetherivorans TaxID=191292 RepID=UPI00365019F8
MTNVDRVNLAREVAIVTGAGAGIGAQCAAELARRGARVLVTDIDGAAARAVAEDIGAAARHRQLDVTDPGSVAEAMDDIRNTWGDLTVAVNNAGVGVPVPLRLHDIEDSEWRRVLDVNLDGAFNCVRAQLAAMMQAPKREDGTRGSIVMMGSIGSLVGLPCASAYVTAKHGLLGMTKAIAIDYATEGIRANLVAPGYVDTAISRRSASTKAALAAKHPIYRMAEADEISGIVCFLASPESVFVTGSHIAVDGGYTAQ